MYLPWSQLMIGHDYTNFLLKVFVSTCIWIYTYIEHLRNLKTFTQCQGGLSYRLRTKATSAAPGTSEHCLIQTAAGRLYSMLKIICSLFCRLPAPHRTGMPSNFEASEAVTLQWPNAGGCSPSWTDRQGSHRNRNDSS